VGFLSAQVFLERMIWIFSDFLDFFVTEFIYESSIGISEKAVSLFDFYASGT